MKAGEQAGCWMLLAPGGALNPLNPLNIIDELERTLRWHQNPTNSNMFEFLKLPRGIKGIQNVPMFQ
jgi:hypothetical protein